MVFRLTAVLLIGIFCVMKFAGHDTPYGPFVENPDARRHGMSVTRAATEVTAAPQVTAVTVTPATREKMQAAAAPAVLPGKTGDGATRRETMNAAISAAVGAAEADARADGAVTAPAPSLAPSLADGTATVRQAALRLDTRTPPAPLSLEPATPVAAATPEPAAVPAQVVGSAVNLRAGPSTADPVIGRVDEGDTVQWISTPVQGWALVRQDGSGADAYMAASYLRRLN